VCIEEEGVGVLEKEKADAHRMAMTPRKILSSGNGALR
jgi:hypothetical protein